MKNKKTLKNLPVREQIHARISCAAKQRGMTIQGLTERILIAWCNEKIFTHNVAQNNIEANTHN